MLYIPQAFFEFFFMIFCGLTNPIVCLFADEYGWLPKIFKYWQTFDNTLDMEWLIYEGYVPEIFCYDYRKHYVYHYENKSNGQMIPGYVDLIDANFTTKEKIQRYFCRLIWLYRNCNYGFSYYVNGRSYNGSQNCIIANKQDYVDETWISYINDNSNFFKRTWCFYYVKQWCGKFALRIYLGWKLKNCTEPYNMRAMIAFHFNPFTKIS